MKAKRIFSVILAAALILTLYSALFAQHVSAEETLVTEPEENFTVKSYGGDDDPFCYITGYSGNSADLVIPDTIGGKKVVEISDDVFKENYTLTSVSLPSTLYVVGNDAFEGCYSLKTVTWRTPQNYDYYGISIGDHSFAFCYNLKTVNAKRDENEHSEGRIERLGRGSFDSCHYLESIDLMQRVSEIPDEAFRGCEQLKYITLYGVSKFGDKCFAGCYSLSWECFFSQYYNDYYNSANVEIGNGAFKCCSDLEYVDFRKVTSLGKYAFEECSNMRYAVLDGTYEKIGYETFSNCRNLGDVQIANTVKQIDDYAFYTGGSTNIQLSGKYTSIAYNAFSSGCYVYADTHSDGVVRFNEYHKSNYGSGDTEGVLTKIDIGEHREGYIPTFLWVSLAYHYWTEPEEIVFDVYRAESIYNSTNCEMECALECYQHKCMERATATVGVENYTPPTHFTDGSITMTAYCRYEDREYTETKTFRVTDSEHTAQVISGYDESCCSDGMKEHFYCPKCNLYYPGDGTEAQGEGYPDESVFVIPAHPHTMTHYERVEPKVALDGTVEFWKCSECGRCFGDSKGENEISPYSLTLTMRGDLDGDKKLTINDATLLQKALAKIRGSLDLKNIDADMNRDGNADIRDVTFMQRVISGYEQDK